eukprot:GHVS01071418.1.p1 GENE.GHVS01071418.1~~GHVS01071418.1.p1  ORF type:complete len:429 (-),score=36.02 GHVS01071418.1:311-1597(-)
MPVGEFPVGSDAISATQQSPFSPLSSCGRSRSTSTSNIPDSLPTGHDHPTDWQSSTSMSPTCAFPSHDHFLNESVEEEASEEKEKHDPITVDEKRGDRSSNSTHSFQSGGRHDRSEIETPKSSKSSAKSGFGSLFSRVPAMLRRFSKPFMLQRYGSDGSTTKHAVTSMSTSPTAPASTEDLGATPTVNSTLSCSAPHVDAFHLSKGGLRPNLQSNRRRYDTAEITFGGFCGCDADEIKNVHRSRSSPLKRMSPSLTAESAPAGPYNHSVSLGGDERRALSSAIPGCPSSRRPQGSGVSAPRRLISLQFNERAWRILCPQPLVSPLPDLTRLLAVLDAHTQLPVYLCIASTARGSKRDRAHASDRVHLFIHEQLAAYPCFAHYLISSAPSLPSAGRFATFKNSDQVAGYSPIRLTRCNMRFESSKPIGG